MTEIITSDLIERIERVEAHGHTSRVLGLRRMPGNPLHAEVEQFGRATAILVQGAPFFETDRVFGFGLGDEDQLDKILDWFSVRGVTPHFDISPYRCDKSILALLTSRGMYQYNFLSVLYLRISLEHQAELNLPQGVEVREYFPDEMVEFGELCADIDGYDAESRPTKAKVIAAQFADWCSYVAFVDGIPAAHATLWVDGKSALMMYARTRPDLRGHGCQTALLQRRITDAARTGCDLLVSASYPFTTSQRNQMRAGMQLAYTKALWTVRESFVENIR